MMIKKIITAPAAGIARSGMEASAIHGTAQDGPREQQIPNRIYIVRGDGVVLHGMGLIVTNGTV